MKHTPGPWIPNHTVERGEGDWYTEIVLTRFKRLGPGDLCLLIQEGARDFEVADKNALLIAEAPEMLRIIEQLWESWRPTDRLNPECDPEYLAIKSLFKRLIVRDEK